MTTTTSGGAVSSVSRAEARVGAVLKDKWTLDKLVGVGGMAVVYAATHRNKKRVAVKMLLPEYAADAEVRARFVREGYAANTIEHPGAVSVLDDDVTDDDAPFLVMELLEGETVDARWERKGHRLEVGEVLTIADQLLDVLKAAHVKGIVHRDVKPENLFLTREGRIKVLDFGIARVLEAARPQRATRAGFVMGTPAFMAPEQAMARWDEVDGRTDLWAVGATMFTLLTGQHVHEADTGNEQLIKSATQPARPLASIVPAAPPQVMAIVDRALAFDRGARWPDAASMQEAVRAAFHALRSGDPNASGLRVTLVSSSELGSGTVPAVAPTMLAEAPPPSTVGRVRGTVSALGAGGGTDRATLVAARSAEREAAAAEVARAEPRVAAAKQRVQAAERAIAQGKEALGAAKKERAAEEERFRRATATRMEGVGEARKELRQAMTALARLGLDDRASFDGPAFEAARTLVRDTRAAADARARDVALHETALASYDAPSLRAGVLVALMLLALLVLAVAAPFVIHALGR